MSKVILSLIPELQSFIRTEFNNPNGAVKIKRSHSIGKYINSMIRFSKYIPIRSNHKNTIEINLPDARTFHEQYYYAYFTAEDERQINDFIQATFDLRIEKYFIQGYRVGFKQRDIVASIIFNYGLPNDSATFEKFKKRDFRSRVSVKNIIAETIKNY